MKRARGRWLVDALITQILAASTGVDDEDTFQRAGYVIEAMRQAMVEAARIRGDAVVRLSGEMPMTALSHQLGVSDTRLRDLTRKYGSRVS